MKVLITGGTGFVGEKLVEFLLLDPNLERIYITTRNPDNVKKVFQSPKVVPVLWEPIQGSIPSDILTKVNIAINLMGENISSGNWTPELKEKIRDSRILGTRNLVNQLNQKADNLLTFISSSAIGIYPSNTEEELTEETPIASNNFLADVCTKWEKEAEKIRDNIRLVIYRTGVVIDSGGGAIEKMRIPFMLGVGGTLGSGEQYMSWIHREDLVQLIIHAIHDINYTGIYNAVAPQPITNKEFTKVLGKVIHRPTVLPVPAVALKLIFGDMSSLLLDSQYVVPKRLIEQDHSFHFKDIHSALRKTFEKQ